MKLSKKLSLVFFFATYHVFMPFVVLNCVMPAPSYVSLIDNSATEDRQLEARHEDVPQSLHAVASVRGRR